MLSFDELCGKPLAAADYLALAENFHSVAISGVPVVTAANRPAAYRFMILIDVLYEQRCTCLPHSSCPKQSSLLWLMCVNCLWQSVASPFHQRLCELCSRLKMVRHVLCRIRVFMSAEAEPFELFEKVLPHAEAKGRTEDDLVVDDNLGFTKDRTISRLIEMQSREYLTQHAEQHAPELLLALHDRKANRKSRAAGRHERGGLRSSVG